MKRFFTFMLVVCVLPACGCGNPKYVAVSGKVTLNNKPLANAMVTFQPVAKNGLDAQSFGSFATTDAEGNYTLEVSSPTPMKGAAVGKHVVRIGTKPSDAAKSDSDAAFATKKGGQFVDPIPARYNAETKLTIDVPLEGTTTANFDLTSP